jgi:hypothetical protein
MDLPKNISVLEKADRLLLGIEKIIPTAGEETFLSNPATEDIYHSYQQRANASILIEKCRASGWPELVGLCQLLQGSQRICADFLNNMGECETVDQISILPAGWKRIEELNQQNPDSQQGFVAMWFDPSMDSVYANYIKPAIEDAGYKSHRVDEREHADRIDDEIIRQIRRSRFVVADATSGKNGARGGVYYEAGFAHGLGMPVFWTCREGDNLHFDVRQYNCIFWEADKLPEFKKKLTARIEAVLGRGKIINDPS